MMPRFMLVLSPLATALLEEVFFRGAVFLILIEKLPQAGAYWAILLCTVVFALHQVIQTDTFGQGAILLIGSTSISVVGCIVTLHTRSFLPTLLCHSAYVVFYLRLASSTPRGEPKKQRTSASGYAGF
jgi:membrane protease YdiL (CAAX protease family)